MKYTILLLSLVVLLASCATNRYYPTNSYGGETLSIAGASSTDKEITRSLFNDNNSTISEEDIKKVLDGTYSLPQKMRVALVKLRSDNERKNYYYRTDEEYLKTQQSYIDELIKELKETGRVSEVMVMPELLIAKTPTFTNIRESAVRMQADVVVVFSINSDVYFKYKVFSKDDIKAFATTEVILMDNRTGLIPFSEVVTRDTLSNRTKEETNNAETSRKLQFEAAKLTITEVGERLNAYLKEGEY